MGGGGVTARGNSIRQTSRMESRRAALNNEIGQGNSHLSLVLLMDRHTEAGTVCFLPRTAPQSFFAKPKMGQEDDGSGNGKGGTLHVGERRDSAEGLSGGT